MASIRQKGRQWQVVWSVYADGKRIQRTRVFATHAAAKEHRAKVELLEPRGVGTVRLALGGYMGEWVAGKVKSVEPNTVAAYVRWVGHIRRCPAAVIPLDRLTPRDLETMYQHLLETVAGNGRPLSPASVRHVHAALQNALNDAVRHQLIGSNPALYARAPRGASPKVVAPTQEQVGDLIDDLSVHNPDLVDLVLVIIGTALRRSEALGLRWSDIDWIAQTLSVRQVVIEHDGKWTLRPGTKSAASRRTLSLAPDTIDALRRQQARVAAMRLKIGRSFHDHDLVFPTPEGTRRKPAGITQAFTRASRRAGWPAHSSPVHSLRHAAASHALAAGVNIATISRRLGHSSTAITARVYLHATAETDSNAAEVMANIPRRRR